MLGPLKQMVEAAEEAAGAGVDGAPAGTVLMWSGAANSIPTGYLLCDGSAINRTHLYRSF